MPRTDDKAFFRVDGEWIIGNGAARGPWSADACHAGPVTGTIARALERVVTDKQIVRLTLGFERPIPMAGFRIEAAVERSGRGAASASAVLKDREGRSCVTASSLHLTAHAFAGLPTATVPSPDFSEAVDGPLPVARALHDLPFFSWGIEVKYPPGETRGLGPTTVWMRSLPIIEGEKPSPFQSLCPIADCGNAIARNAEFTEASFVNADLTITAYRRPESDWLASQALCFWEPTGIGMSQATLFDTRGALGMALQTLIVRPAS